MDNLKMQLWREYATYKEKGEQSIMTLDNFGICLKRAMQAQAEACEKAAENYITNYENLLHDYHLQELKAEILNAKVKNERD